MALPSRIHWYANESPSVLQVPGFAVRVRPTLAVPPMDGLVVLVMADEPHGSHWGSEVCGPAFADIATESMRLLRLREGTNAPAPNPLLVVRHDEKKGH